MRSVLPSVPMLALLMLALFGCAGSTGRQPGETAVRCIHRLYDYPDRQEPFQTAASACGGEGPVDLTGDRYFQVLASTLNVPYVTRDPKRDGSITLTGSRVPQSTDAPAPPELSLR